MERNPAMKLQYHKIRGVDKSVCTAEQKIAYNMASRIYGDIRFAKAWQQYDSGKVPAFLQNDWESKAIRTYFTTWQRDYNKASAHRTHHSHHQNKHRFLFRHQNLRCL